MTARTSKSSRRPLPVAEATYPPPAELRRPAAAAAPARSPFPLIVAAMGGIAFLAVILAGGFGLAYVRPWETAANPQTHTALARLAQEYADRAFRDPVVLAVASRYADLALLNAPPPWKEGRKPNAELAAALAAAPVRIRAVVYREIPATVTRSAPRTLLFVAYDVTTAANLSSSPAADAVLAYIESGYRAYPADAALLLVWSDGPAGPRGRAYAVDLSGEPGAGVAVTAVDPDSLSGKTTVALAIGDPLNGTGRLITRWRTLPADA